MYVTNLGSLRQKPSLSKTFWMYNITFVTSHVKTFRTVAVRTLNGTASKQVANS